MNPAPSKAPEVLSTASTPCIGGVDDRNLMLAVALSALTQSIPGGNPMEALKVANDSYAIRPRVGTSSASTVRTLTDNFDASISSCCFNFPALQALESKVGRYYVKKILTFESSTRLSLSPYTHTQIFS